MLDLGFDQFTVRINDRRILNALAAHCGFSEDQFNNLFIQIDKLDKIGLEGVKKELLVQSYPAPAIEGVIDFLSRATTSNGQDLHSLLPPNCPQPVVAALDNVIKAIKNVAGSSYSILFDPSLVRGMGYYTGQIFEIISPGQPHSMAGGGRYDKMVGKYTGREVPACGLSIGFERLITILMEKGIKPASGSDRIALIFDQDRDQMANVFLAANNLRRTGKHVSLLPKKKEMRKQIDALIQEGFSAYAVYYPDKELPEIKTLSPD